MDISFEVTHSVPIEEEEDHEEEDEEEEGNKDVEDEEDDDKNNDDEEDDQEDEEEDNDDDDEEDEEDEADFVEARPWRGRGSLGRAWQRLKKKIWRPRGTVAPRPGQSEDDLC
ncbi:prostatic spermine-binding protein-like [Anolis sagrei]|uniref:prostatic spermine-binding protein-like n=1 Tax=Anolis sagrei TaxID=38937 RepID=UPI0035203C4C